MQAKKVVSFSLCNFFFLCSGSFYLWSNHIFIHCVIGLIFLLFFFFFNFSFSFPSLSHSWGGKNFTVLTVFFFFLWVFVSEHVLQFHVAVGLFHKPTSYCPINSFFSVFFLAFSMDYTWSWHIFRPLNVPLLHIPKDMRKGPADELTHLF